MSVVREVEAFLIPVDSAGGAEFSAPIFLYDERFVFGAWALMDGVLRRREGAPTVEKGQPVGAAGSRPSIS